MYMMTHLRTFTQSCTLYSAVHQIRYAYMNTPWKAADKHFTNAMLNLCPFFSVLFVFFLVVAIVLQSLEHNQDEADENEGAEEAKKWRRGTMNSRNYVIKYGRQQK